MIEPIKPQDIAQAKVKAFPDFVMQTFNELIAENFTNGKATVRQCDVIARMVKLAASEDVTRNVILNRGWLNVEEIFREAGWKVTYDKPAYNECYEAFFEFKDK